MKSEYLIGYDSGYADGVKTEREKQKAVAPAQPCGEDAANGALDDVSARAASPKPVAQTERALTDEQIEALVIEHSEWTPQGMAIVDSHRRAFARALLTAAQPATNKNSS